MSNTADLRGKLGECIAAASVADTAAGKAASALEAAAVLYRAVMADLAAYDGLDERMGQHRAEAIAAGVTAYEMPADIAAARAARDHVRGEQSSLEAAMKHLADRNRIAAKDATEARRAVTNAAGAVMAAEIEDLAQQALATYFEARGLWDRIDGMLSACPVRLDGPALDLCARRVQPAIWETMTTPISEMASFGAKSARLASDYLSRLCTDPDARADDLAGRSLPPVGAA